jgi:hypothetical protein
MRIIFAVAVFALLGCRVHASTTEVPNNGSVTVVGDFASYDQEFCNGCDGITATISFSFSGGNYIGATEPDPTKWPVLRLFNLGVCKRRRDTSVQLLVGLNQCAAEI